MIKEPENKPLTPIMNPDTGLEVIINVFISVSYVPGLSEEFRGIFDIPVSSKTSKEHTPLNLSLCILKIKFHQN